MYSVKLLHRKTINNQTIVVKSIIGVCALHKVTKVMQSFKDFNSAKAYCSKNNKAIYKVPSYPAINDIENEAVKKISEVGDWELYEVDYYDTTVIMPNGEKIKKPSYANAIRYCSQHKEYLAQKRGIK